MIANNAIGKGLISKTYKQLTQLNSKKKKKTTTKSKNGQKTFIQRIDIYSKKTYR